MRRRPYCEDLELIRKCSPKELNQLINNLRLEVHAYAEKSSSVLINFVLPAALMFLVMLFLSRDKKIVVPIYSVTGIVFVIVLIISTLTEVRGIGAKDLNLIFNLTIGGHLLFLIILFFSNLVHKNILLPFIFVLDISLMMSIFAVVSLFHLRL